MENQPAATGRQWLWPASLSRLRALGQSPDPTAPTPASPAQAPAQRNPLPQPPTIAPLKQAQTQPPQPPTTTTNAAPPLQATSLASDSTKPPPPSPIIRVSSRSPTPPESPRGIKPTNPQESPKIRQLRPIKSLPPQNPEPELKQLAAASSPKSMFMPRQVNNSDGSSIKTITDINGKTNSMFTQQGNNNGGVKTIADIDGKILVNGNQSKINDAKAPPPSFTKRETTKNGIGMATTQKKDDHNAGMKVITMAGENIGAYMDLGSPNGHQHHIKKQQQQHGYHQTKVGGQSQNKEDGESEDKMKDKGKKSAAADGKPMASLVNSNVQSVNNSILFGTSCAQQNPGVHISLVSHRQPKHKETM